jgi:hypothetical protein
MKRAATLMLLLLRPLHRNPQLASSLNLQAAEVGNVVEEGEVNPKQVGQVAITGEAAAVATGGVISSHLSRR